MKKIYWRIRIAYFALQWVFVINLGDWVDYRGKKYIVANGVRNNSWRLSGLENGDEGWVLRHECKKIWTVSNCWGSFKSGYRFYMTSWYSIWLREGIEPWGKNLSIWK